MGVKQNPRASQFSKIASGTLDKGVSHQLLLHLQAGVTYQFKLDANTAGVREALEQGSPSSTHHPASGQYSRVYFNQPVTLVNTPDHTGDYYLDLSSTYGPAKYSVSEKASSNVLRSDAAQLAESIRSVDTGSYFSDTNRTTHSFFDEISFLSPDHLGRQKL